MNRPLYKTPFYENHAPSWACPNCGKSVLRIKKGTFKFSDTADSMASRNCPEVEYDWIKYIYSCLLECSDEQCKGVVANLGEGHLIVDYKKVENGEPEVHYLPVFLPKYFQPYLKLFSFPKKVPEDIAKEIEQSFELFFCSPSSASNHIRIALEYLLTYLKVKKYVVNNKKKRVPLFLHRRIDLLPDDKYSEIKGSFFAIKWLGNAGSHSTKEITMDDVMDAYEMFEYALKELFDNQKKQTKAIAKQIIKKKGPRKKVLGGLVTKSIYSM